MKLFTISGFFFALLSTPTFSQVTVDSIYHCIKSNSIYSQQVNWDKIDSIYHSQLSKTNTLEDSLNVFSEIFKLVGDFKAKLFYKNREILPHALNKTAVIPDTSMRALSHQQKNKIFRTKLLQDIVYIRVPTLEAKDTNAARQLAQALYDSTILYTADLVKSYIIDLRLSTGGNIIATLAGLSPLLGEGSVVKEIDASGRVIKNWNLRQCNVYEDSTQKSHIRCRQMDPITHKPVVVLLSPITSGAGNFAAIAFKRRLNTYFIGEATDEGMTGIQEQIHFSNEISLQLTTHVMADRANTLFPSRVSPDKRVLHGDRFDHLLSDKKIRAAVDWFSKR